MTIKYRHTVTLLLATTIWLPSAFCQGLPNTNMGKFVHQPGDNQYQPGSQIGRHGTDGYLDNTGCTDNRAALQRQQAAQQAATMPAYTLAPPPPPGPDVSIEAIAAEEPVPQAGFPPLPLALDLPVTMGVGNMPGHGAWNNQSANGGSGGGSGGNGGYSGEHEHYGHYEPGSFVAKKNNTGGAGDGGGADDGGGGAAGNSPAMSPAVSTGNNSDVVHSGYKVRTAPPIMRADTFSNQANAGTGKGAGTAPTMVAGRSAGAGGGGGGGPTQKAPGLDDSQDAAGAAPEIPTATGVFQTQSEDLTLPDDEYASSNFKNGRSNQRTKQYAKQARAFGRQLLHGTTGLPIGF